MPSNRRSWIRALSGSALAIAVGQRTMLRAQTPLQTRTPADWRSAFPALDQTINGRPLVYLDSAATTQRPSAVIDAVADFYRTVNANPSSTLHTLARRAADRYAAARTTVARFINADPRELVWVRGTTEGINLVAASWGAANLRSGDEIVLPIAEHYSNWLPWRAIAARTGARIRHVGVTDEGHLRLDELDGLLSPRTRLVAISHVSNVLGLVNPVAEIVRKAKRVGATVLVDGAQSVPHVPVDVKALGCDFFAFSSHKMLGPMGTGVLWARRELLEAMPTYQTGSNMAHEVDLTNAVLEHDGQKFQAGTPNVSGAVGLAAAVEFLDGLGRQAIWDHDQTLVRHTLGRLREVPGLRLIGPTSPENRVPVFCFTIAGVAVPAIVKGLDDDGLAIRGGDMAAQPLLERFGVKAAARVSCYLYNTTADIDQLVDSLQRLPR